MQDLVVYLARALVDNPDPVEVHARSDGSGVVYELTVHRDDLGKVIGKKGRTAKAIRSLLATIGHRQDRRIGLEIMEPPEDAEPSAADSEAGEKPPSSAGEKSSAKRGRDAPNKRTPKTNQG